MVTQENLKEIRDNVWEIPTSYQKGMRVPGRIYLDRDGIVDFFDIWEFAKEWLWREL